MMVSSSNVCLQQFYFEHLDLEPTSSFKLEIILSVVLTVILFGFQLLSGLKNYKEHKQEREIDLRLRDPSSIKRDWKEIAAKSVHYSGYLVGHVAWGFVICFHLILLFLIGIRILFLPIRHVEIVVALIVPVVTIYLLKMASFISVVAVCLPQDSEDKSELESPIRYAVFVYFIFVAGEFEALNVRM